ncbi:hypothetical protein C8Q78DRAFT_175380 [Trametes maxima]|nr:hypothetical protein C8Q78DRAFT_175380 [Trametes maxima]
MLKWWRARVVIVCVFYPARPIPHRHNTLSALSCPSRTLNVHEKEQDTRGTRSRGRARANFEDKDGIAGYIRVAPNVEQWSFMKSARPLSRTFTLTLTPHVPLCNVSSAARGRRWHT